MKYTLKDVFGLFTQLKEVPPEIQTIKNNFPLRIFSDVSSGLAISDVDGLNFSEFIKAPNSRQIRGIHSRTKQYAPKAVAESQQISQAQHHIQEEPIHWDKPDPNDKFDDLLCPDFRANSEKDTVGESLKPATVPSNDVWDVMDLISATSDKKSTYSKHQSPLTNDLPVEAVSQSNNAKKVAPVAHGGDDIEDVLQKLDQDHVIGSNMESLPESHTLPEHRMPMFPIPPSSDAAIFGLPAIPYTQVLPGAQSMPNQVMFSVYHSPQQAIGFTGPMSVAPAMPMPTMHAVPGMPGMSSMPTASPMYTIPMQQPSQVCNTNWEYLDFENIMRGPFSSTMMWRWYKQGSLPNTLRIRIAGDSGPFLPLVSRWAKSLARGIEPFSMPPSELSYQ